MIGLYRASLGNTRGEGAFGSSRQKLSFPNPKDFQLAVCKCRMRIRESLAAVAAAAAVPRRSSPSAVFMGVEWKFGEVALSYSQLLEGELFMYADTCCRRRRCRRRRRRRRCCSRLYLRGRTKRDTRKERLNTRPSVCAGE